MRRVLITVIVISLILCIPVSLFITLQYTDGISEMYYREITLAEDIVIDDPEFIEFYGKPLTLTAGMKGHTVDAIDNYGDTKGYEYINAHFLIDDGYGISIAISIDPEADTMMMRDSNYEVEVDTVVFSISKIESYQTVLSEYFQTRERFHARVRNAWVAGIAIAGAFVGILVGILFFMCKRTKTIKIPDYTD